MAIIFYKKESETKAFVASILYNTTGFDPQDLAECLEVGEIPEPEAQQGKLHNLYVNPKTKELWYEYTDRPLTAEEKMEKMEAQLKITQDALDALLLG
ncbi:hypothetical protein [Brevibacillus porteri]|uniref:Uncharacterized protein n=1 Tax=Brevibacillus porteri TaxID=2126350 RepID=A0ABX5FPL5_9BACL|nr:hypothetical protein [Brevibacillus porteri]MED1800218.1 hypothetical protein [Brevibacillus porteri]MED2133616.1 hypothetical protein [Brevibacillus porteri]MED2747308.1 hypothetical protein [Brevibacillus porteri]MED2813173.1 hypothetical protein [Brevibacillus porteri]MED2892462.1 hypothetical protein [Brevibacillus porteri]